jgi:hypothetical protein
VACGRYRTVGPTLTHRAVWQFLSTNEVEICFEFIVVRGEAELPPGTVLCVPFPVGQSVVAPQNVVVTVRLID